MFKLNIIILISCLSIAGCGYKPLYGVDSNGRKASSKLAEISVDAQTNRQDQLIRNEILSSIGANNNSPQYSLSFSSNANDADSVQAFNADTLRKSYQLNVKFDLIRKNNGKSVLKGTTFAHVSYDKTAAPFSDYQAKISAQERAAKQVGNDIRTRLAAYFASH